jgi:hypothetical protein
MRKNHVFSVMIVLLSATLPVSDVQAQNQGAARPGGGSGMMSMGGMGIGPMGLIHLMDNEKVLKELELTDDQKTKVAEAVKESSATHVNNIPALSRQHLGPQEMQAKMMEAMKINQDKFMKKMGKILLPQQFERLKQIHMQAEGTSALLTADVIKALNITNEQQKEMKTLNDEFMDKLTNATQYNEVWQTSENLQAGAGQGSGYRTLTPESREMQMNLQKQREEALLQILTQDQRDQFEKLKGAKLDLKGTKSQMSSMSSSSQTMTVESKKVEGEGVDN